MKGLHYNLTKLYCCIIIFKNAYSLMWFLVFQMVSIFVTLETINFMLYTKLPKNISCMVKFGNVNKQEQLGKKYFSLDKGEPK